jgi:hypothetical protein
MPVRKRRIKTHRGAPWTTTEIKQLGKTPDSALARQPAPLKFVQQLFPPRLRHLHSLLHVLLQYHFISRCHIHRSRYTTTFMTPADRGATRYAYFSGAETS